MGITKTDLFTSQQNEIATVAKALAHPARIAILQHLLYANACINSDLVKELGLAQATISQHLKELKDVGLIQGTIDGASMNYCINHKNWKAAQELLNDVFESYQLCNNESCC